MTATRPCPQCGKLLSSDAPEGLCPQCLLQAALPGQSALESSATGPHGAAAVAAAATAVAARAGARLKYFGDYELLEEIARGGMGVVWKARQTSLHRDVAIKMIRAGALASPDEVRRFLREAEAAANLQHPHIVAIHEVGEHDGLHYFSMDYVAGRDLGALVKDGPLAARVAARYVKTIAEAIHFAHQRGTLHRDLKPQNVLIDAADQPRITDFGLAKIRQDDSRLTQSGVIMGSPSYMPPEQAAGRHGEIGPPSDVYSLGAILYELLTGLPPFRAATALATLRDVMEAEPAAPRRLRGTIPPDLETICLKCLEKSPAARYPTARALAEELDRFLKGEPIQARPAGAVRKTVSWARRHPGTLAALAALVIVGLAFGVFFLFEENAFLRAQQADPALARIPGPRHEALEICSTISTFASSAGVFWFLYLTLRARGLSLRTATIAALQNRPQQPLGERTRQAAIGVGLLLLGDGVLLLVMTMQAHVWEGESIMGQFAWIYLSIYWGLVSISFAIGDYRLVHYGTSSTASRPLTAAQIEPIRRALEDHDWAAAVQHYRDAVPDADRREASQYVVRLWQSLRAQYPERFALPPLSLATLNWKAMGICIVVEAVLLGLLWAIVQPSHSAWLAAELAFGVLFGLGLLAGLRVKGFWKMVLLMVPTTVAMAAGIAIMTYSAGGAAGSAAVYVFGFFFGVFLMVSGFTRRRR